MIPITGRASSFLEILNLWSQSKLNPNPIYFFLFFLPLSPELCGCYHFLQSCCSFFVLLHGQPEPFGNHLLQSCFSFFIHLHGQTEPFGSCIILQSFSSSSVSTTNLATTFSSLIFLSSSFSSPCFNLLREAKRCFSWSSVSDDLFFSSCSFWFSFLLYLFRVLSSAFLS